MLRLTGSRKRTPTGHPLASRIGGDEIINQDADPVLPEYSIEWLGHAQADVLVISWGGGVAQHFALVQRKRCRRLVLGEHGDRLAHDPGTTGRASPDGDPPPLPGPGYLRQVAGHLYGGSARSQPDQVSQIMHAESRVGSPQGCLYQLAGGAGWTSLPFLPLIQQSKLILAGDDDPLIPLANARLLHALIPRSQLHVYHGGHTGLVTEAASSRRR